MKLVESKLTISMIISLEKIEPELDFSELEAGDLSVSGRMNEPQGGKKVAYCNKFTRKKISYIVGGRNNTSNK